MCELIYFSSINIFGVNSKLIKGQLQLSVGVCVYACVCLFMCAWLVERNHLPLPLKF